MCQLPAQEQSLYWHCPPLCPSDMWAGFVVCLNLCMQRLNGKTVLLSQALIPEVCAESLGRGGSSGQSTAVIGESARYIMSSSSMRTSEIGGQCHTCWEAGRDRTAEHATAMRPGPDSAPGTSLNSHSERAPPSPALLVYAHGCLLLLMLIIGRVPSSTKPLFHRTPMSKCHADLVCDAFTRHLLTLYLSHIYLALCVQFVSRRMVIGGNEKSLVTGLTHDCARQS